MVEDMMQDTLQSAVEEKRLHLPIGYSDFATIVRKKLDFVDKTLLIKEIFDNIETQTTVIVRPRRFGKTLNLSMMRYFLAPEVHRESTQGLFDNLKIAQLGDRYMKHQGKYPVIFISFKDVRKDDYSDAYMDLCHVISQLYNVHDYLASSPQLSLEEKELFLSIIRKKANSAEIGASLQNLTYYIYKHTGIKPWLLIDEYDTPIQSGYLSNYYQEIISIMRTLLGAALKDNVFLERAAITGILRVSKESLFSGINNLKVYSILNKKYAEHFGFTESEVKELLVTSGLDALSEKIRRWYNGYEFGSVTVYNPWSIVNCISEQGLLRPYWVNTSGNDLIRHILGRGNEQIKMELESLLHGETISALIDENISFNNLERDKSAFWSLLLFSGYLKVIHLELKWDMLQCELAVPNQEILALYQGIARDMLAHPLGREQYLDFLLSLTEGRVEEFTERLEKYLEETLGIFDTSGKEPEKFYHGFVLGMMVSLNDTHEVKSNRESGYGRYDVMLIPKDPEQLGIILEFKTVRDGTVDLKQAALQAMQQINDRRYEIELKQKGIQHILKIALAFRGKQVHVLAEPNG